jgi:hypothetical protein
MTPADEPSGAPDFVDDLVDAFRKYCRDRKPPRVSSEALEYIRHCLARAARLAAGLGEVPHVHHHPTFALMALEGDPRSWRSS